MIKMIMTVIIPGSSAIMMRTLSAARCPVQGGAGGADDGVVSDQ